MKYEDFEYNKILDPISKTVSQNKICKAFAKKYWDDGLQLKDEMKQIPKISFYLLWDMWSEIFWVSQDFLWRGLTYLLWEPSIAVLREGELL